MFCSRKGAKTQRKIPPCFSVRSVSAPALTQGRVVKKICETLRENRSWFFTISKTFFRYLYLYMKSTVFIAFFLSLSITAFASDSLKCPGGYFDSTLSMQVYEFADVDPSFPGGPAEMIIFIMSNFVYPQITLETGAQSTVYVGFVVSEIGELLNVRILHQQHNTLSPFELEAIRVITIMPNWIPGLCNGQPVACEFVLPLSFHPK